MPRRYRQPTRAELVKLDKLKALSDSVQAIQAKHAADIAAVNAQRVEIIIALRDAPDGGIPVIRQSQFVGVHYTTLFRLLPVQPKPAKAEATS